MALWAIIELGISAVGLYNIAKGAYVMYCDAEVVKDQYRKHRITSEEYLDAQLKDKPGKLTQSVYHKHHDEFLVVDKS